MSKSTSSASTSSNSSSESLSSTERLALLFEFITYIVSIITTALLTNYLTSTKYSHLTLAIYTFTLIIPLLLHGSNLSIFTYFGSYFSFGDSTDLESFLGRQLRVLEYGSLVFLGITILVAFGIYIWDPKFYHTGYKVIIIYLFVGPLWIISAIQCNILLSLKQYIAYFVTSFLSQPLWYLIFPLVFILKDHTLGYKTVLLSIYASFIVTIVGGAIWIKVQPNTASLKTLWDKAMSSAVSTWRVYNLKLFFNSELGVIKSTAGAYILVYFSGVQSLQKVINSINLYQLLLGLVLCIVLCTFASNILSIFGAEYTHGAVAFRVYCVFTFFTNFSTLALTILKYAGDIKTETYINIAAVIFLCMFGAIMTHYFHLTGYIVSLCVTYLLSNLVACGVIRTQYSIKVMSIL